MLTVGLVKRELSFVGNGLVIPGKHLGGREASQRAVVVVMVVPLHVITAPSLGMLEVLESPRTVRLVLQRFKASFTHGIVVAHARPTVASSPIGQGINARAYIPRRLRRCFFQRQPVSQGKNCVIPRGLLRE